MTPRKLSLTLALIQLAYSIAYLIFHLPELKGAFARHFAPDEIAANYALLAGILVTLGAQLTVIFFCWRTYFSLWLFPMWLLSLFLFSSFIQYILLFTLVWWCFKQRKTAAG